MLKRGGVDSKDVPTSSPFYFWDSKFIAYLRDRQEETLIFFLLQVVRKVGYSWTLTTLKRVFGIIQTVQLIHCGVMDRHYLASSKSGLNPIGL